MHSPAHLEWVSVSELDARQAAAGVGVVAAAIEAEPLVDYIARGGLLPLPGHMSPVAHRRTRSCRGPFGVVVVPGGVTVVGQGQAAVLGVLSAHTAGAAVTPAQPDVRADLLGTGTHWGRTGEAGSVCWGGGEEGRRRWRLP
jgi:hypothetical protein